MAALLLAVEVGGKTLRVGAFDPWGRLAASAARPLDVAHPAAGHAVQRMDAIWHAAGLAIHDCLAAGPGLGKRVAGLGFAACPALVLECDGEPPLEQGCDIFAASDRRAAAEAAAINATGDPWLGLHGGAVPPGNSLARLLWLMRQRPGAWSRLRTARDLCDELARRATGVEAHSVAALATQWPWQLQQPGQWRHALLDELGLGRVPALGALGGTALAPGMAQGTLLAPLADLLGLPRGIPVATGLPVAQAGLLGLLGRGVAGRLDNTAVLVGAEATALLCLSAGARSGRGFDGPFLGTPLAGLFLCQAAQARSGAPLDAVLADHPGGPRLADEASHAAAAAAVLDLLRREGPAFAASRHVVPHNDTAGLATGLGDQAGPRMFLETYYATARGLALQLRQVIAQCNASGFAITRVALGGAHAANRLLARLYRDALGGVVVSDTDEPVLLGAAMAAAVAAGIHPTLAVAVDCMAPPQARLQPDPFWRRAHDAAFDIYLGLVQARNTAAAGAASLAAMAR